MKVAWLALVLLATVAACKSLPEAGVGVASIRFRGNHEFRSGQLEERIATQETPKFLGLFRASWRRYQDFAPEVLEKDLERLRHFYERHGYYDTQIRAGRVVESGKFVEVEILVQEGPPVLVHSIAVRGLEAKPTLLTVRVSDGLTLDKGDVFDQEKFDASTKFAAEILADHGYAYADVTPRAVVDLGPRTADLAFQIDPGIECKFGPITFEGLDDLPEKLIRRTFGVESGEPYEADDLDLGRRALVELGVFASVDVTPDLSNPKVAEVPIKVVVTRSALRGFRLGGGLLLDYTRSDVHGLLGWEHRNFLGGMRRLALEERPSLVFFPTALSEFRPPHRFLPANSASVTLRQPAFPEARTTTSVRLENNIYPVLVTPVNPNQEVFPGYFEIRAATGPERYFPFIAFRGAVIYNFQANFPFAYAGQVNPAFDRVVASYIDLRGQFDLRDDPIVPRQGFLLQNSLQFAGGIFGGDAEDVRIRPEMRMYVPVSGDVVIAARAVLGLLLPRNYGSTLGTDFLLLPPFEAAARPYIRDLQLTYFRGFFAGGADSNRGYGYRDIGPHGVNPLFIPGTVAEEQERCQVGSSLYDDRLCLVATGGLSLWEASIELRTPIYGDFGAAFFVDTADVSPNKLNIRLYVPHLSVGVGMRYATPVGPLRLDVGLRVPGMQKIGAPINPLQDGPLPPNFLGLPIALSIAIGEAY